MILDAWQGWLDFWKRVGDFFLIPDGAGLNYLTRILIALGVIVVSYFVIKFIGFLLKKAMKVSKGPQIDSSAKFFIIGGIKIILWICVAFLVISLLKIEVTGIAGITSAITVALGLALQDLIGCFVSGLLVLHQKNILTGDYISIQNNYGSCEGTVIHIRFFFTNLRTPQGQIVTVPNSNVQKAVVTNFSKLGKRRIDLDVGFSYDVDIDIAKKALNEIIEEDERILKDEDKTVYIVSLDSYSVKFRIRCWTPFSLYWPVYNEMNEKVLRASRKYGLRIPSSTDLHIEK